MVAVRLFHSRLWAVEWQIFASLGGILGAFLTGLFSQQAVNKDGYDGAFYGRPIQMWYQIAGILTGIGE